MEDLLCTTTTYTWAILTSAGADADGVGSTSTGSEAGDCERGLSSQVMTGCACSPASRVFVVVVVVGGGVGSKKETVVKR